MPGSLRSQRFGWYVYDWANSAFYTTVVTVFLAPYISSLASAAADPSGNVRVLGFPVYAESYWSLLVVLSVVLQVVALPVVGAIADASAHKKRLLAISAYIGAGATVAMYWLREDTWPAALPLFVAANVAFGASIVISNSFLNDLASPEERDTVSSRGWAIGYLGGGLMLVINLLVVQNAGRFGLTEGQAVRIALASAGAWWAVFTLVPLATLRDRPPLVRATGRAVLGSFGQFVRTLREIRRYPQALTFLIAYLLFNDAVQAVIALSGQFAVRELGIGIEDLVGVILAVQFVGFLGALLFGWVARIAGTKRALMIQLVIWTVLMLAVYAAVHTLRGFWIASIAVALVLGGTQALSRSLFSLTIPKGKEAEYFSLYEIGDKGTAWLAPAIFGITLAITHNYRSAMFSLIIFFVLGLAVLQRVDVKRAIADAEGS
jgi:UMF1 family MFS transporter